MTNKITVEIDLDEAIQQRYRSRVGPDDDEEPIDLLGIVVQDAAYQLVRDSEVREAKSGLIRQINQIRTEEIRGLVRAEIEAALVEPVQRTSTFGEPVGEPTSLRELILAEARTVVTGLTRQNGRSSERSLIEKIIKDELTSTFERELRAALTAAKQQVVQAVHQKGAIMLANTIADMAETVAERQTASAPTLDQS